MLKSLLVAMLGLFMCFAPAANADGYRVLPRSQGGYHFVKRPAARPCPPVVIVAPRCPPVVWRWNMGAPIRPPVRYYYVKPAPRPIFSIRFSSRCFR